jgi:hypothetical protein
MVARSLHLPELSLHHPVSDDQDTFIMTMCKDKNRTHADS